jgi:phosphoribosylglycinamide formyltransferase-1
MNIAVMVSGNGSNLQALIDAIENGGIPGATIVSVISSQPEAYALTRASKHGIPVFTAGRKEYPDENERHKAISDALKKADADLIVLAGYMLILPSEIIRAYKNRIINIHPSLIPKYCGKGYYGLRVHQAVIDAGESESGATVHYVDEGIDTGPVILQARVKVVQGDDAETLAARVLEAEHRLLVSAVRKIVDEL